MQNELMIFKGHVAGHSESSVNTLTLTPSTPRGARAACDSDLVNSQAETAGVSSAASLVWVGLIQSGDGPNRT